MKDNELYEHTFPIRLLEHMKVIKKGFRADVDKFSVTNRVVNEWNALSEEIITGRVTTEIRMSLLI